MRKLNAQWIEIINGQKHMVKAVAPIELCKGCLFNCNQGGCCWKGFDDCQMGSFFIIKDLGVLNEDGCLPNCWGEYPRIEELVDVHIKEHWFRCITRNNVYCATDSYKTKQEAIDAWNRRV